MAGLKEMAISKQVSRENIDTYTLSNGKQLHLLGGGALVNIACADGHPAEIMDMSFALQALSAEYLVKNQLDNRVYDVPTTIDEQVAYLTLANMDTKIDQLTERQQRYLSGY